MEPFKKKLEEASTLFSDELKRFNEETTPHMLGVLVKRVSLADEFKKICNDIKVAC